MKFSFTVSLCANIFKNIDRFYQLKAVNKQEHLSQDGSELLTKFNVEFLVERCISSEIFTKIRSVVLNEFIRLPEGLLLWNSLDSNIKSATSLSTFRRKFKNLLLSKVVEMLIYLYLLLVMYNCN